LHAFPTECYMYKPFQSLKYGILVWQLRLDLETHIIYSNAV